MLLCLFDFLLEEFQIGEHQLRQNQLQIAGGIDGILDMDDVRIIEQTDDMRDGINRADMPKKLITKTFAFARAFDKTRDVDEFHRGGNRFGGMFQFDKLVDTRIRNRHDARIRLDGAEREIGGRRTAVAEGVEESGFADVRQSHKTTCETHGDSFI